MDPLVIVLAVVGAGLMISRTVQTMRAYVNHHYLASFVVGAIRKHRIDHVHSLCDNTPAIAFSQILKPTLVAASRMPREWSADECSEHLGEVYYAARKSSLEALHPRAWHGWLAPVIACGGVVLSLDEQGGAAMFAIVVAIITVIGTLASISRVRKISLSTKTHANKIIEALVEAHTGALSDEDAEPAERIMRGDFPSLNELIGEHTRSPRTTKPDAERVSGGETTITDKLLDLRNGTCPLCKDRDIGTSPMREEQFVAFVCRGCGYTQWFAEDPHAVTAKSPSRLN